MEFLGTLFNVIYSFYTWPLGFETLPSTLFGYAFVALASWIAWLVLSGIVRSLYRIWYIRHNRARCVHCDNYTLKQSSRNDMSCQPGDACCAACQFEHALETEPARYCTHDTGLIAMHVSGEYRLIRHICPECESISMSAGNYLALERHWYDQGYRKAEPTFWGSFGNGVLFGFGMGMLMGASDGGGD